MLSIISALKPMQLQAGLDTAAGIRKWGFQCLACTNLLCYSKITEQHIQETFYRRFQQQLIVCIICFLCALLIQHCRNIRSLGPGFKGFSRLFGLCQFMFYVPVKVLTTVRKHNTMYTCYSAVGNKGSYSFSKYSSPCRLVSKARQISYNMENHPFSPPTGYNRATLHCFGWKRYPSGRGF